MRLLLSLLLSINIIKGGGNKVVNLPAKYERSNTTVYGSSDLGNEAPALLLIVSSFCRIEMFIREDPSLVNK